MRANFAPGTTITNQSVVLRDAMRVMVLNPYEPEERVPVVRVFSEALGEFVTVEWGQAAAKVPGQNMHVNILPWIEDLAAVQTTLRYIFGWTYPDKREYWWTQVILPTIAEDALQGICLVPEQVGPLYACLKRTNLTAVDVAYSTAEAIQKHDGGVHVYNDGFVQTGTLGYGACQGACVPINGARTGVQYGYVISWEWNAPQEGPLDGREYSAPNVATRPVWDRLAQAEMWDRLVQEIPGSEFWFEAIYDTTEEPSALERQVFYHLETRGSGL